MEDPKKKYRYRVYLNGNVCGDTWAVSAKKAVSNVAFKLRQKGLWCDYKSLKAKPVWDKEEIA